MPPRVPRNIAQEILGLLEKFNYRSKATDPNIDFGNPEPYQGQVPPVPEQFNPEIQRYLEMAGLGPDAPGMRSPTVPSKVRYPLTGEERIVQQPIPGNYDFDQPGMLDKLARLEPNADLPGALFNEQGAPNPLAQVNSALDAMLALKQPGGLADAVGGPQQKSQQIFQATMAEESMDDFIASDKRAGSPAPVDQSALIPYQDEMAARDSKTRQDTDRKMAAKRLMEGPITSQADEYGSGLTNQVVIPGQEELHPTDALLQGIRRGVFLREGDPRYDVARGKYITEGRDGQPVEIDVAGAMPVDRPGVYPEARWPVPESGQNITERTKGSGLMSDADFLKTDGESNRWYQQYGEFTGYPPQILRDEFMAIEQERAIARDAIQRQNPGITPDVLNAQVNAQVKRGQLLALRVPNRPQRGLTEPITQGNDWGIDAPAPLPEGWTAERAAQTIENPSAATAADVPQARAITGATNIAQQQMPGVIRRRRSELRARMDKVEADLQYRYASAISDGTPMLEEELAAIKAEYEKLGGGFSEGSTQAPPAESQSASIYKQGPGAASPEQTKDIRRLMAGREGLRVEPSTNTTVPPKNRIPEPMSVQGSDSEAMAASALPMPMQGTQGRLARALYPSTFDVQVPRDPKDPNSELITRTARPQPAGLDESTQSVDIRNKRSMHDDVTREQTSLQLPRNQTQTLNLDPVQVAQERLSAIAEEVMAEMPGAPRAAQIAEIQTRLHAEQALLDQTVNRTTTASRSLTPPKASYELVEGEGKTYELKVTPKQDTFELRKAGWMTLPRNRQVPTGNPGEFIVAQHQDKQRVLVTQKVGDPIEKLIADLPPVAATNIARVKEGHGKALNRPPAKFRFVSSGRPGIAEFAVEEFRNEGFQVVGHAMREDAPRLGLNDITMPRRHTPQNPSPEDQALPRGSTLKRLLAQRIRQNIAVSDGSVIFTDEITPKGEVAYRKRGYYDVDKKQSIQDAHGAVSQEVYRETMRAGKKALAINPFEGTPESNARAIVNWMLDNQIQVPFIEGHSLEHLSRILPARTLAHPSNLKRKGLADPRTQNKSSADIDAMRAAEIEERTKIARETMRQVGKLLKQVEGEGTVATVKTPRDTGIIGQKTPTELAAQGPDPGDLARAGAVEPGKATGQELDPNPTLLRAGRPGLQSETQANLVPLVKRYREMEARFNELGPDELDDFWALTEKLQLAGSEGLLDGMPQILTKRLKPYQPAYTGIESVDLGRPADPRDTPGLFKPGTPVEGEVPPLKLDPSKMGQKPKIPEARIDAAFVAAQRADPSLTTEMWQQFKKNRGLAMLTAGLMGSEAIAGLFASEDAPTGEGPQLQAAGFANSKALAQVFKQIFAAFRQVEPGQAPLPAATDAVQGKYAQQQTERAMPTVEKQAPIGERARTAILDQKLPASKPQRDAIKAGAQIESQDQLENELNLYVGGAGSEAGIGRHNLKEAIHEIDQLGARSEFSAYLDAMSDLRAWSDARASVTRSSTKAEEARLARRTGDYNRLKIEAATIQDNITKGTVAPKGKSETDAQAQITAIEQKLGPDKMKAFEKATKVIDDENRRVLKLYRDEGLISEEAFKELDGRKTLYVPLMQREGTYDAALGAFVRARTNRGRMLAQKESRGIKLSLPEQKLVKSLLGTGDKEALSRDPLDAWAEYHQEAFKEVARNRAARAIIDRQRKLPGMEWDEKSKTGIKFVRSDEALPEGAGAISVMDKGVEKRYAVPLEWAEATTFAGEQHMNGAMKLLAKARVQMQALATSGNVAFAMRNIPRDLQGAAMLTPDMLPTDYAKLVKLYARNVVELASELRPDLAGGPINPMKMSGGKNREAFYESGADLSNLSKNVNYGDEYSGSVRGDADKNIFGKAVAKSQRLLNATEQATKEAVFEILVDKYRKVLPEAEARKKAAIYTREFGGSPDFAKMGTMTGQARDFVMFFNPQVQGLARMAKAYKQNPMRAAWHLAATTAGISALDQWNRSERDENGRRLIENVPEYERNSNIIIMTGGTTTNKDGHKIPNYFKIPLAHEARPFLIPIQDAIGALRGDKNVDPITTASNTASTVLPGNLKVDPRKPGDSARSVIGALNPILKTGIELGTNVNSLSGAPIVGTRAERGLASNQGTEGTSPTMKLIGEIMGKIGFEDSPVASPQRLEHAYRGSLPGLGEAALDAADMVTRKVKGEPALPGGFTKDFPMANQLARSYAGGSGSQLRKEAADPFYEAAGRATKIIADMSDGKVSPKDPRAIWAATHNKSFVALKRALAELGAERDALQQRPGPGSEKALEALASKELALLQAGAKLAAKQP